MLVLHFIFSSRVMHSLFCYVGVVLGFLEAQLTRGLFNQRQESCLEIGRDHCFGHVLPPPPSHASAPSCVFQLASRRRLGGDSSGVCL